MQCTLCGNTAKSAHHKMGPVVRKPAGGGGGGSDQARLKPVCSATLRGLFHGNKETGTPISALSAVLLVFSLSPCGSICFSDKVEDL